MWRGYRHGYKDVVRQRNSIDGDECFSAMEEDTLTALSQRDEAFWLGLLLLISGNLIPRTVRLGDLELAHVIVILGGLILVVRLLVGVFRLFRTAVKEWLLGYQRATAEN